MKTSTTVNDPQAAAERILNEYGDRWLESTELAIAKIYHEVYRADFNSERLRLTLDMIRLKYNVNPQVLLNTAPYYGYRLGLWEESKAVSDYVKTIYSTRDQSVFMTDAGYAFMEIGEDNKLDDCYQFYSETSALTNVVVNGCARLENNKIWIAKTEANLSRMALSQPKERMAFLKTVVGDAEFIAKYENLLKADIKSDDTTL